MLEMDISVFNKNQYSNNDMKVFESKLGIPKISLYI